MFNEEPDKKKVPCGSCSQMLNAKTVKQVGGVTFSTYYCGTCSYSGTHVEGVPSHGDNINEQGCTLQA